MSGVLLTGRILNEPHASNHFVSAARAPEIRMAEYLLCFACQVLFHLPDACSFDCQYVYYSLLVKAQRREDQIGELASSGRAGRQVMLVTQITCAHLTLSLSRDFHSVACSVHIFPPLVWSSPRTVSLSTPTV